MGLHSFVSWQARDSDWVERLVKDLRCLGADVWWSGESLSPSGLWIPEVSARLESAAFFLPVFTPEFFESTCCWREVQAAVLVEQRRRKFGFILPLLLRKANVPALLAVPPPIDFTNASHYAVGLAELARRIGPADAVGFSLDLSPLRTTATEAIVPPEARQAWAALYPGHQRFLHPLTLVGSREACTKCHAPLHHAMILREQSGDGGNIMEAEPGLCCSQCHSGYFKEGLLLWWRPCHLVQSVSTP